MGLTSRASGAVLLAALCWLAGAAPVVAQSAAPNGVGTQFELTFWQSVDGSDDPALYEAYLTKYPDGTFSPLARAKIAALRKAAAPAVSPVAPVAPVAAPAPAPVPQVAPAGLPVASPAAAPRFAEKAPEPEPAPVPAPAAPPRNAVADAGNPPSTLGALLAALAHTQESGPASVPAAAAVAAPEVAQPRLATVPMPRRPALVPVPPVALPASFCSAEARNAFHDATYQPAVEAARRNNDAAVGYMRQIQTTYDSYQLSGDTTTMNALAAEARAWQPLAADAFAVQSALVHQFDALMAVPIAPCPVAR